MTGLVFPLGPRSPRLKTQAGRIVVLLFLLVAHALAQNYHSALYPALIARAPIRTTPPEVKRARPVEIETALFDLPAAAEFHTNRARLPFKLVTFDLFDDVSFRARLDRAENAWDGKTIIWSGSLEQSRRGQVILAATGKMVSATLTTDSGAIYRIRHAAGRIHWAEEVDFSRLPPESEPIPVLTPQRPDQAPAAVSEDGSIIDVMVVYTPAARKAAGGPAEMNNLISLAVAETNQGYANSGVIQRIRLVHSSEIDYTESGNLLTDLNRITDFTDDYLDEVSSLRERAGADMVSLWVASGDACGIAYLMTVPGFFDWAYSVIQLDCAVGAYALGHEMGHNQGSTHDASNASIPGLFPYSYGYQQQSLAPYFRTIMAYACSGVDCPRINHWSSPANTYSGIATGISSTNNVLSLNNTREIAANWRQPRVSTISISPTSAAFTAAGGTGIVTVTAPSNTFWEAWRSAEWVGFLNHPGVLGTGTLAYSVAPNTSSAPRKTSLSIEGEYFVITQAGASTCGVTAITVPQTILGSWNSGDCSSPSRPGRFADRYSFVGTGGQRVAISLSTGAADTYLYLIGPTETVFGEDDDSGDHLNARIPADGWFTLPVSGVYVIEATTFGAGETGAYVLQVEVAQGGCTYSLSASTHQATANGGRGSVSVVAGSGCPWLVAGRPPWINVIGRTNGTGNSVIDFWVLPNQDPATRSAELQIGGSKFTVFQGGLWGPLRFVAITPCRLVDTRTGEGRTGLFGPPVLLGGATREIHARYGECGVPSQATAYSINVTVVPRGPLGYLTVWPAGEPRPLVSTLNSLDGKVVANAAIVPGGVNGSISIFSTHSTDVVIDINGYFSP